MRAVSVDDNGMPMPTVIKLRWDYGDLHSYQEYTRHWLQQVLEELDLVSADLSEMPIQTCFQFIDNT